MEKKCDDGKFTAKDLCIIIGACYALVHVSISAI